MFLQIDLEEARMIDAAISYAIKNKTFLKTEVATPRLILAMESLLERIEDYIRSQKVQQ